MSEVTLASDSPRWVRCKIGDVNIRIIPKGSDGGSAPTAVYIVAEGASEKVTWRTLESKNYDDAIDEAKNYAAQWVRSGMPSSGYYRPLDPIE